MRTQKFPFSYAGDYTSCMCIYKLSFNDHFYVAGCKRLKKRALQHSEEIERKLRLGLKPEDPYTGIINYLQTHDVKEFVVEIIFPVPFESELPDYEQRIFDLVKDNPKCLNTSFVAKERTYRQQKDRYHELNTMPGIVEDIIPEALRKKIRQGEGVEDPKPASAAVKVQAAKEAFLIPTLEDDPKTVSVTFKKSRAGKNTIHTVIPLDREIDFTPASEASFDAPPANIGHMDEVALVDSQDPEVKAYTDRQPAPIEVRGGEVVEAPGNAAGGHTEPKEEPKAAEPVESSNPFLAALNRIKKTYGSSK